MAKKVSIYTIAKKVGVSTATVSKVINNKGYVSQEVAERVLEAIQKYEYVPAQKKLSNNAIGVVCFHYPRLFSSSFSCRLMTGISDQAFREGNELLLINGDLLSAMSSQELFRYRFSHATRGYLLLNTDFDSSLMGSMLQANIPFINLGNASQKDGINYVSSNNYESASEIVDYMIGMGHRRIAVIGPLLNHIPSHQERLKGYLDTMKRNNITVDQNLIAELAGQESSIVRNALKKLLGRSKPPTAIFFINTECGNQIYSALIDEKCRVPEDISLGGCYEAPDKPWSGVDFTSFGQPAEEMGRIAVLRLKELEANPQKQLCIRLNNSLSFGETVSRIS